MSRTTVLRAAVLVVASLLASACTLPGTIRGSREISAVFDDVGDLVVGHSVQVADVRIGSIVDIELTDDYQAEITMSIKDDVFVPVESRALLRTTSLLGEKFIELRPLDEDDPMAGTDLVDGDVIAETATAPELEFVTEQAVEILGAVVSSDVATLIETGAVGFGGRTTELTSLVEDLSTVSGTLADQTDELVRIIDALDGATATLASSSGDLDELLGNLAETATVLADNRDVAIDAIRELTRLARIQNDNVFEPYLAEVDTQIKQVDAILAEVDRNQAQVAELLRWVAGFADQLPKAVADDFAQVFLLAEVEA
ncbi:MlaD family protein [Acidimicrobiia bacterium EGI L10123]|uniref:MlaD family protein n=1 Tax=Salinilacustrithrix flava TaxID=2957203 RepID=UPI003D7C3052|nr:MlaD family protein [Acidimicrobiia bacterium EGI L10123]